MLTLRHRQQAAHDLVCSIRDTVNSALAPRLRAYNAASWRQRRLPDELWCMIWRLLPLKDRFAVCAVCHAWRGLALSSPAVWTHIEICCTGHGKGCTSDACADPTACTNLRVIEDVLARSRQLPLTVEIVHRCESDYALVASAVAQCLAPHTPRIAGIYLHCEDGKTLSELMSYHNALPALRVLDVVSHQGWLGPFLNAPVAMPALRYLDLSNGFMWTEDVSVSFPLLHTLSGRFAEVEEIERALTAAPALSVFSMRDLNFSFLYEAKISPSLRERVVRIPELHVSGVTRELETWFLAEFDRWAHERLSMAFVPGIKGVLVGRDFLDVTFGALDGLNEIIAMSCTVDDGRLAVLLRDTEGRARLMSLPEARVDKVWDLPSRLSYDRDAYGDREIAITIDAELWDLFTSLSSTLNATDLVVRVRRQKDIDARTPDAEYEDTDYDRAFSRIQSLRFVAASNEALRMPIAVLVDFLRRLGTERTLSSVSLEGIALDRERGAVDDGTDWENWLESLAEYACDWPTVSEEYDELEGFVARAAKASHGIADVSYE